MEACVAPDAAQANQGMGFRSWSPKKKALVIGAAAFATSAVIAGVLAGTLGQKSHSQSGHVDVLYAGSLVNLMQDSLGPSFAAKTGITVGGTSAGSSALATAIKNQTLDGDVFISASPSADTALMGNGDWVSWYINFGNSPLVLGYNPNTTLGETFATQPWHQALQQPNVRIGRTDPTIDPKGNLTIQLMNQAATFYNDTNLVQLTLGAVENPAQIFPEQTLVKNIKSGALDVGFFYSIEAVEGDIPFVTFPAEIAERASYTITVINHTRQSNAAAEFVAFVLSADGEKLLQSHGMNVTAATVAGNAQDVPAAVKAELS